MTRYVVAFADVGMDDVALVGGKNASLGEMIGKLGRLGIAVPDGFATTADAFREFLRQDGLDAEIHQLLESLDVDDTEELARRGAAIRAKIKATPLPAPLEQAIADAWRTLAADDPGLAVAIRSSATAEDLPEASFAGQQETLLNVCGLDAVIAGVHEVYASLFNDRAIAYRVHQDFDHSQVALSVGVQRMVRSDLGAAGVLFTLDTESGFRDVVFITAAYGLGETVVQGSVNPDEYYVYKPALEAGRTSIIRRNLGSKAHKLVYGDNGERVKLLEVPLEERNRFALAEADIESLARQALVIEKHYGRPMDIEWGKDGRTGELYILQARPETVQSQRVQSTVRFSLKEHGRVLAK
ncbi:MAG: phosphoenolpyruvate synthase, partial [Xanthomonadaceae bacterium]|nr:phosphoenolpyruvate synthase [Xanthomonadaceae bacterium]